MNDRICKALGRKPDFIIGQPQDPYLLRWWIIPKNRFFNVYLHKFMRSDDDRALHDHPWLFNISVLLKGTYFEHKPGSRKIRREAGTFSGFTFRWGKAPHRVELLKWHFRSVQVMKELEQPVWTLFITGPKVREWGFYCPKGWRHWRNFVSLREGEAKGNEVGRGCDD